MIYLTSTLEFCHQTTACKTNVTKDPSIVAAWKAIDLMLVYTDRFSVLGPRMNCRCP